MSKDQVALVTGAGRGIGRGIAIELSRTHRVIGTYRARLDTAESLRDEYGVDVVQCDIGSKGDRAALLEYVKSRYGRLDLVVNNAGMAPRERRDILDADEPGFDELIAVNVKGTTLSDATRRADDDGTGFGAHRLYYVDIRIHGIHQQGRLLHFEGCIKHVRRALCAAAGEA